MTGNALSQHDDSFHIFCLCNTRHIQKWDLFTSNTRFISAIRLEEETTLPFLFFPLYYFFLPILSPFLTLEAKHHVSTTEVTGTFSLVHSIEDNLKRTNCHRGTTGARWQGGSWAYFRRLSIPQWQESVSDVPLASTFFGSGLVSV